METAIFDRPTTVQGFNKFILFLFSLVIGVFGTYYILSTLFPSLLSSLINEGNFFTYIPFVFLSCLVLFFITFFVMKKILLKYNQKSIVYLMLIVIFLSIFSFMNFSTSI